MGSSSVGAPASEILPIATNHVEPQCEVAFRIVDDLIVLLDLTEILVSICPILRHAYGVMPITERIQVMLDDPVSHALGVECGLDLSDSAR